MAINRLNFCSLISVKTYENLLTHKGSQHPLVDYFLSLLSVSSQLNSFSRTLERDPRQFTVGTRQRTPRPSKCYPRQTGRLAREACYEVFCIFDCFTQARETGEKADVVSGKLG